MLIIIKLNTSFWKGIINRISIYFSFIINVFCLNSQWLFLLVFFNNPEKQDSRGFYPLLNSQIHFLWIIPSLLIPTHTTHYSIRIAVSSFCWLCKRHKVLIQLYDKLLIIISCYNSSYLIYSSISICIS